MKAKSLQKYLGIAIVLCLTILPTSAQTLKVGYLDNYGIVADLNSLDNKGYGYDILQASTRYSDVTFEYVPITEDQIQTALNNGTIDVFGPLHADSNFAQEVDYSRSFGVQQIMLVAPANSSILFNDTASFQGSTITMLEDLDFSDFLDSYATSNKFQFTYNKVSTPEAFYSSENQLLLASSIMNIQNRKAVANLGVEEMFFVSKKGNSQALTALNGALSALEVNDPLFMYSTHEKYYKTGTIAQPVLTAEQRTLLQQKSTFTVGYLANQFPIESLGSSGAPEGVAVDIMSLLAKEAGIGLSYQSYYMESASNLGGYDINIAWAGTEDFNQFYYASNSFDVNSPLMLVTKDGTTNPNATVTSIGMLPYVTFDTQSVKSSYPSATFSTYNSYQALSEAMEDGSIEAVLLSEAAADYLVSILGDNDYSVYATSHTIPIRIFINKNLGEEYLEIFNILIARVNETEIDKAILDQISNYRTEPTLLELMGSYWYIYVLGIAFVTGSFFALYLILQRKKQQAVLDALNVDEITGLASEIKFITDVEYILKTADDNEYMIGTFDIDHFSLIRKQYGYDRSNDVLKKIGATLVENYPEGSIVARSKADLFLIFSRLPKGNEQIINNDNVIDCAQGLLASTHPLSISQGLYRIADTTMPVQLMIDYSNMARQQGKSVYGLTLNEYTKELDAKRELNNSIVLRMERALLGKELIPYYQPKVHVKTSLINGAEALVRWCDIDSDLAVPKVKYMPDEFIPLFEENGFIAKLDYHIFDEICSFIRRNMKVRDIPKISINLSGVTLLKNDLRGSLVDTLNRYRVAARDIDLEITESAFTQYPKESAAKVRQLRDEGFTISMDDFGTGASSLNRLADMAITTIKLDKAFLDYNLAELKGSVIIGNMINMARRLGLEVVAEGVETKQQLTALKMLHCDLVQGYYFSKPINEDDFLEILGEPVCLPDKERIRLREEAARDAAGLPGPDDIIIP
ncbi:MAG: EAL domain-containing protein [Eubacteriales bacterium]